VGAAIRNGTAATVRRVDVNSFFMLFSLVCAAVFVVVRRAQV
jgi:hypothetical protein